MKKFFLPIISILILNSCSDNQKEIESLQNTVDSLSIECAENIREITILRDSIEILRYPASQRLEKAKSLILKEELNKAENELHQLVKVFPNSKESTECDALFEKINSIKAAKRAEEERIKALGFKAIKQKTTFSIDYNKINLSNISIGKTFVFDAYNDEWYYREADRGNKYVTMAMSVTSTSKSPNIPQFAIYKISGDKMEYEGTFTTKYARWSDYGSYLGNYHDSRNDFSKVSTVNFKLGCEVSESITKAAFAIVVMNKNVLEEQYERFNNPPQYWSGSANYPMSLSVSSFEKDYTLIKLFNLK